MLLCINLWVFHEARINYPLIFELDLRSMLDFRQVLELPAFLYMAWSLCFWLSMSDFWPGKVAPWIWSLVWPCFAIAVILNPFVGFHMEARWWFIRRTARVFTGGLLRVQFTDFWIGDQLVSQYYLFYNLGYFVCLVCLFDFPFAHPV